MASETTATQTSKSQNFNLLDKDSYEVKTSLGNFISLGRDFYRDRINQNIRLTSNNLTCVSNQYGCWDHLNNEYVRVFINESKLVSYFKSRGFLSKSPQIRQISLLSTFTTVLVVAAAAATAAAFAETDGDCGLAAAICDGVPPPPPPPLPPPS
jgi:hypothetical protein